MTAPEQERIWGVVLAGGVGSRFWPVSTPSRPKQLLPLGGDEPLVTETVRRVLPLIPAERLRILTSGELVEPTRATLDTDVAIWAEPRVRGTGPVLAWAAHRIAARDPDAIMISLHADHLIRPDEAFLRTLRDAAAVAHGHHRLVTLGVVPTRPETGYGYIRRGEPLAEGSEARDVEEFVEKPDAARARRYVESGDYLWNSGIFIWRVRDMLEELRRHTPELAGRLPLLDQGEPEAFFSAVPVVTIDEGLLERSDRVAVLAAGFQWDDVGAWDAVARTGSPDAAGNVTRGPAHLVESENCIAWSEDGPVVLFGVRDLVVVRANGVTLVADRGHAPALKRLLGRLPDELERLEP